MFTAVSLFTKKWIVKIFLLLFFLNWQNVNMKYLISCKLKMNIFIDDFTDTVHWPSCYIHKLLSFGDVFYLEPNLFKIVIKLPLNRLFWSEFVVQIQINVMQSITAAQKRLKSLKSIDFNQKEIETDQKCQNKSNFDIIRQFQFFN